MFLVILKEDFSLLVQFLDEKNRYRIEKERERFGIFPVMRLKAF